MEVEFTARQVTLTDALREQAEEGLERIAHFVGRTARASITFSAQKHLHIVEVTIQARSQTIAAEGKAETLKAALHEALIHAENQAQRSRDRKLEGKRLPKGEKVATAPPVARIKSRTPLRELANGAVSAAKPARKACKPRKATADGTFPSAATPHIVNSSKAIATNPMTVEEAVKDAEFRDLDLLIFRSAADNTFVLHRRRDGQMELVEMP